MSRPFKHPRTGIYWLRRRVPQDLVALVGRREISRSLGTRDPAKAKQKIVQALADLDAQWAIATSLLECRIWGRQRTGGFWHSTERSGRCG